MSAPGGQKNLVTQACFEFCRTAIPAYRMEVRHSALVKNDGVIAFDADESIIERAMMKRTQTKAVLELIRSALVVNRNDVRRINEIELHSADCAAIAVSSQHVLV